MRLFRRSWVPEAPRHALLLVHGYAEHSGRYEAMATWFAERGHAVHGYDHRGHGRSQGARCHVDSFEQLLDDLDAVLEDVRDEHGHLPVTLVGHSMGGLVTAAFLAARNPLISSAVTSGAALHLGEGVSRTRIAAARLARRLLPKFSIGSGLDPSGLSRDPQVVRDYLADPLVFRTMTTSLAAEILDRVAEMAGAGGDVRVPLLMLHGADDPLCPPGGSEGFFAEVDSPGSALRIYPELRHEIFNEPEREEVYADILAWLEKIAS